MGKTCKLWEARALAVVWKWDSWAELWCFQQHCCWVWGLLSPVEGTTKEASVTLPNERIGALFLQWPLQFSCDFYKWNTEPFSSNTVTFLKRNPLWEESLGHLFSQSCHYKQWASTWFSISEDTFKRQKSVCLTSPPIFASFPTNPVTVYHCS